ncbi:MAG: NAD(P)H-dependent glycerol-3-phosphate dehydrogenase [Roseovarius sp.]
MIRVMGAGAFGTALAIALADRGPVVLWARDAEHARAIAAARSNARRLPGIALPAAVSVEGGPAAAPPPRGTVQATLLAMPAQRLRGFCEEHAVSLAGGGPLVVCCKGVELSSGLRPSQVIAAIVPQATVAVLTGPSFARDIARGLPTALTLACGDAETGKRLQALLSTATLRLYRSGDVIGAELGGALKNVIAIACGAAIGAGLGESARAALMTRGFAEMSRAATALGAAPATLSGLSGFGDLVLTCTSEQSRNYRYGLSLGRDEPFDASLTVEGAATARAMAALAARKGLEMPITDAVTGLVSGRLRVAQAMDMLLSRPLKEE